MPVDENALAMIGAWVEELAKVHLCGCDEPLFPASEIGLGKTVASKRLV